MPIDLESVTVALNAAEATASALQTQINLTLTSTDRIALRSELIDATNTINDLDDLEARISAGESAVPSLAPGQVTELQTLSQQLDQRIVAGQLLNFSSDVVATILDSAVRVSDIVKGNLS